MNVSEAMQESKALLSEYKMTQQPQAKQQPGNSRLDEPKPKPQDPVRQHSSDVRTSERLSQTKKQPNTMPPPMIIRNNSRPDIEQYKKEQGDLMVRDMIRQLQQENSSLQAQQNNLRSTFSQYFSPDVLHYLENNKGTFQTVDNEKHLISVLFCDIRGFSNYSLTASSEEIVKYLGEYFEIASHYVLQKHNGIISKYTATIAALGILHEVALRNQTNPGKAPLNIGIGIATGEVIVGNIGSDDFKDFTLIGPAVNMASRLENANKDLGTSLLISDATYKALQGRISCRDCGEVEIRGWQNTEHVYAPVIKKLE
jgi:class 3 adenylate cyclase